MPPFLRSITLVFWALLTCAPAAVPYAGPFERLDPLPAEPASGTTAYEVHADIATMAETPAAEPAPYWLAAWTEKTPLVDNYGISAPTTIRYRRLTASQQTTNGPPLVLTRTASAATLRTVRGTGGAWIVSHAASDGLRAWWIPAHAATPVPPPITVWGSGGASPDWVAAGDGATLWIWLQTPATSGPGFHAAPQQRMAVLDTAGGGPVLRRLVTTDEIVNLNHGPPHFCADGGVAVLTYPDYSEEILVAQWSPLAQRRNRLLLTRNPDETYGAGVLGTVPWSDGEFLTILTHVVFPLTGERITGTRINRDGAVVPGSKPLVLAYAERTRRVLPLRSGGVMPASEGVMLFNPSTASSSLFYRDGPVSGTDGTPGHFATVSSRDGMANFHSPEPGVNPDESSLFYPLTEGAGFSRAPLLSWAKGGWPMLSWTQCSDYVSHRSAFYRRRNGWQVLEEHNPPAANHASGKGFHSLYESGGDISGTHWVMDATGVTRGDAIGIASGLPLQKQAVLWNDGSGHDLAGWVEQSTDPSGDKISKIRERDIYPAPSPDRPPVTRHLTGREISRLLADPQGYLIWQEEYLYAGNALVFAAPAYLEPDAMLVPQIITTGVSSLLSASNQLAVMVKNYQPVVFARSGGTWSEVSGVLAGSSYPLSVAVAGNCLFRLSRDEANSSVRLYMQTFTDAVPGPVELLPTGPVLPDQLAAATDGLGRYVVAVRPMEATAPVLTLFVLAPGLALDPALLPTLEAPGRLSLSWRPSTIYPSTGARFQRSPDLIHWEPVPTGEAVRSPARGMAVPFGFKWILTAPDSTTFFFRMEAQIVP